MKLHEYQSKELFRRYGIPVPAGEAVRDIAAIRAAFDRLGAGKAVLKAQIHAGGRGKAGGIRMAGSAEEAEAFAASLLGKRLVTAQTGPEGWTVSAILIEVPSAVRKEVYAGIVIDRALGLPVLIVCGEGGTDIEEVVARSPENVLREPFDPDAGLRAYQARRLFLKLGLDKALMGEFARILAALARLFVETDCSLAEINPLAVTEDIALLALDAKLTIDDNALWRHKELAAWRDPTQESPREAEAAESGMSYIGLDGNIGCMVNGAGLAMATMDILKLYGGRPANFLDVGGGVSAENVEKALKIILGDERVRVVLVNIFGGIVRCDLIAEGLIAAARQVGLALPLVVRLEGTNAEAARRMLKESGLAPTLAEGLAEAAQRAVELAKPNSGS
jgi:succinyl-CoA synthetase beta subunit